MNEELEIVEFQLVKTDSNGKKITSHYGINVDKVREVIRFPDLTEYPQGGEDVIGVSTSREKITPLIHLSRLLGLSDYLEPEEQFVIVTDFSGSTYGFLIDSISRIYRIAKDNIEVMDELSDPLESSSIIGAARLEDKLVFILNIEEIVSSMANEMVSN